MWQGRRIWSQHLDLISLSLPLIWCVCLKPANLINFPQWMFIHTLYPTGVLTHWKVTDFLRIYKYWNSYTRQHSNRMRTACFPTVHVVVAANRRKYQDGVSQIPCLESIHTHPPLVYLPQFYPPLWYTCPPVYPPPGHTPPRRDLGLGIPTPSKGPVTRHTHPSVDRHTPVKTLPSYNYHCRC